MSDRTQRAPTDPLTGMWLHAMRAQLDAVVLQFEAQLRSHVAATSEGDRREREELEAQRDALAARLATVTDALREAEAERDTQRAATHELARERDALRASIDLARAERRGDLDALRAEHEAAAAKREAEHRAAVTKLEVEHKAAAQAMAAERRALEERLAAAGVENQRLGEQFSAEREFVSAALTAEGSSLATAVSEALGAPIAATPECYAALKAKRPDAVLAQCLRERGRAVLREPLAPAELKALAAMAQAAGCALVEVPAGQRYQAGTMEKASTRPEPAEEGLVLECLAPGLRLASSAGSLVFPKVVVATG